VAGKYKINPGSVACTDCEAGKYKADPGVSTACDNCEAGKYKAAAGVNTACDHCEAGKYKTVAGVNTACDNCVAGKHSGLGATTCVDGIPPPDIEDDLMQAAKKYPTCNCTRSWREIRHSKPNMRTGGLGELMVPDKYEVWMCLQDNMCSSPEDWFCYVFNEHTLKFEAWGFNSDVKVVKSAAINSGGPSAIRVQSFSPPLLHNQD